MSEKRNLIKYRFSSLSRVTHFTNDFTSEKSLVKIASNYFFVSTWHWFEVLSLSTAQSPWKISKILLSNNEWFDLSLERWYRQKGIIKNDWETETIVPFVTELWLICSSLWRTCFHLSALCIENYLILHLNKTLIYSHHWFKMLYRPIFNPSFPSFSPSKMISWYCLQIFQTGRNSIKESSLGWQTIIIRANRWLPWIFERPQEVTNRTGLASTLGPCVLGQS